MASITIRDLDPELKSRLRVRAARHGRSMEEEVRVILRAAVADRVEEMPRLGSSIQRRFQDLGGIDLTIPDRAPMRRPPTPR
jgi:plasmid stability protein